MSEVARLLPGMEHACGYLPGHTARSLFVDPAFALDPSRYQQLLARGFRRSGDHAYRPACADCRECRAARIPVADFRPDRAQQRCLQRNRDVDLQVRNRLTDEHFALYSRYLTARHAGARMDPDDAAGFHHFLSCGWGRAEIWELRAATHLLAVAVVDRLPEALSAVYTFFDPAQSRRSLGTLAVLRQIERARAERLAHVYLGYWVAASRKMAYKARFRPLEILDAGGWQRLAATGAMTDNRAPSTP